MAVVLPDDGAAGEARVGRDKIVIARRCAKCDKCAKTWKVWRKMERRRGVYPKFESLVFAGCAAEVPLVDAVELVRRGEVKILCDDVCVRAVLEPPLDFFHPRAFDNLAPLP